MAFSDWWEDFTNQTIPKASKSLSIKKHHALGMSAGNIGQLGGANVITSNNIPQGQAIYINPQTGASVQQGTTSYPNASSWTTTAGTYTTGAWSDETWGEAMIPDIINEVLVSLGFIENSVENSFELDLKTLIRIPKYKLAKLEPAAAQHLITKYLDEMKKKIIEKVTDKIIANKLISLEKLAKDPNKHEC
jgi:hypothetical protein